MIYRSYHGSPNRPFTTFDVKMCGKTSETEHAKDGFFFTSELDVAASYSKPHGFVGRFSLHSDNPLDMPDEDRDIPIGEIIQLARTKGHDALILRSCVHPAYSPVMRSDIFIVFEATRANFEAVELDHMPK